MVLRDLLHNKIKNIDKLKDAWYDDILDEEVDVLYKVNYHTIYKINYLVLAVDSLNGSVEDYMYVYDDFLYSCELAEHSDLRRYVLLSFQTTFLLLDILELKFIQ